MGTTSGTRFKMTARYSQVLRICHFHGLFMVTKRILGGRIRYSSTDEVFGLKNICNGWKGGCRERCFAKER